MRRTILHKPFPYKYYYATLVLAVINLGVYLAGAFNTQLSQIIQVYGGLSVAGCIKYNMWWQPLSYMFIHGGFSHLFFNMFGLLMFGIVCEKRIGSTEFLVFYILCGIFDGLVSLAIYYFVGAKFLLIGASGALYSVLLLYSVLFPDSTIFIWGIIPVKAPILVLIYAVIEIVSEVLGASNIAHLTHLTGFIMAFLYIRIRMGINPFRIWKNALKN